MTAGRIPSIEGGIQPTLLSTTGDIMYASSASNPARLGIGSSAQVLTVSGGVPSWATATSGGMTLLSTTTLSGASTTISSIDQTYTNLYMVIYGMTNATGNGNFVIRPNAETTAFYGVGITGTTLATQYGGAVVYPTQTRTSIYQRFNLMINNYTAPANDRIIAFGYGISTDLVPFQVNGCYASASAVSSLVFLNTGGNWSTGTVLLYGVK